MAVPQDAYCTLLITDGYLPGAMVLAHSLRDLGTKKLLVALVTLDTVSAVSIEQLQTVYDRIIPVERISNKSLANLYLMDRPDLDSVFTKVALWRQTQFRKIVYIDADAVALRAPDELFARESTFAAAPDVGWPDCFNSGVMALTPNMGDYYALLALAQRGISFDGADQGLLNMHFTDWDRLSFTYNCTPSGNYQYVPAYKHFQSSISVIHFIGRDKPWLSGRDAHRASGVYDELLGRWWAVYDRHFRVQAAPAPPPNSTQPNAPAPAQTVQNGVDYAPALETGHITQTAESQASHPDHSNHHQPKPETDSFEASMPHQPDTRQVLAVAQPPPPPVPEAQRFSPPRAEWDPIRQPPPSESRPEAANFPSQTYTMSEDRALFQPPSSYPEPPKDMWYEVPQKSPAPETPKTIFPWEATQAKPTRVFPEEKPAPPLPSFTEDASAPQPGPAPLSIETSVSSTQDSTGLTTPTTPVIQVTPSEPIVPFAEYSRSNAWDEMPEIEKYMGRFRATAKRAKVQVIHSSTTQPMSPGGLSSRRRALRGSLILTDFPSEVERPSLPVTPAPVRRPSFWGEERDSDLPPAQGVPRQEEWDPLKKLEELQRKQVEVLERGPLAAEALRELPLRDLPESARLLPTSEETDTPLTSVSAVPSSSAPPFDSPPSPSPPLLADPAPEPAPYSSKGGGGALSPEEAWT